MFCHACGVANADTASRCAKCGTPLRSIGATPMGGHGGAGELSMSTPLPSALGGDDRYAPSAAAMSSSRAAGAVGAVTEEEAWSAFTGGKADYYLPRFARLARGGGAAWHWPAFFITWWWLLYRKMWAWAALYFFLPYLFLFALGVVAGVAGVGGGAEHVGEVLVWGWLAYVAGSFLLPPLLANRLYFNHARSVIATARAQRGSNEQVLARIEARGGTSHIALIIVVLFAFIAGIGMLAAIALPAYQTYTIKAKVHEAAAQARTMAESVGQTYEATGALPDESTLQPSGPPTAGIQAVHLNPANGVLTVDVRLQNVQGSIVMVPTADERRHLTWTCATADLTRYAPLSCRNSPP
jgi:Tfp pilus assembly protein PilE